MDIAIDFDGTCVEHDFPRIGNDIGAVPVLKALVGQGHNLILFTMWCEDTLKEAVGWFKSNGIPLYGVNTHPGQAKWTSSPKAYCHLMIDDVCLGVPLIKPRIGRPYVDWVKVAEQLYEMGALENGSVNHD